ncbi:hypothetical protein ACTV1L_000151 [Cronobacter turicensis]|nr:hypothetical protein [Cronobacter turicensis]
MTALIKVPFASSGDKSAMPETDSGGGVNMTQGYGQAYSLDPATDPSAKRIERDKMNWLFNLITQAINEIQVGGVAPFISTADNGGSPFAYKKGSVVLYNGVTYQSLEDNNTTTPPDAKWAELKNSDNGLTRDDPFADIKADGASAIAAALANLGIKTAALRDVGTGANQIPDMSSFTYTTTGSGVVIRLPGNMIIQMDVGTTDSNGFYNVNMGVAMSSYQVFAVEGHVSGWTASGGIYQLLTVYGAEKVNAGSFNVRSATWRSSDHNFTAQPTVFNWIAIGRA